jgi:hypothetical protein
VGGTNTAYATAEHEGVKPQVFMVAHMLGKQTCKQSDCGMSLRADRAMVSAPNLKAYLTHT